MPQINKQFQEKLKTVEEIEPYKRPAEIIKSLEITKNKLLKKETMKKYFVGLDNFRDSNSSSISDQEPTPVNRTNMNIIEKYNPYSPLQEQIVVQNPSIHRYTSQVKHSLTKNLSDFQNLQPEKEERRKSVMDSIQEINNNLGSRFKFSKIDLEDINKSSNLRLGQWNKEPTQDLLIKIKKEQRRKEYWNRRMNL